MPVQMEGGRRKHVERQVGIAPWWAAASKCVGAMGAWHGKARVRRWRQPYVESGWLGPARAVLNQASYLTHPQNTLAHDTRRNATRDERTGRAHETN